MNFTAGSRSSKDAGDERGVAVEAEDRAGSCRWSRSRSRRSARGTRRRGSRWRGPRTSSRPAGRSRRGPGRARPSRSMTPLASAMVRTNGIMILTLVRPISSRTKLQRLGLHREAVGELLGEVPRRAAVADHRVLLVGLEQLAADEVGVLVGLEVAHPHDHRLAARRPRRGSRRPRRRAARRTPAGRGTPRSAR